MTKEFDLIRRFFSHPTPQAVLGPGDDCALVKPSSGYELAISTDMLVAGNHFYEDTEPELLGWKTIAVNFSDLAAMGARPRWALFAGAFPEADEEWLGAFCNGLFKALRQFEVDLIGGDMTRGPYNFCVTVIGEVKTGAALRRDRAKVNDDIWISGSPGFSALALAELQQHIVLPESLRPRCYDALYQPQPRIALGLGLTHLAHAAIDVSDGLLADCAHILERSQLSAEIFTTQLPALPTDSASLSAAFFRTCQLAGGDDYELLFTAPKSARKAIEALSAALTLPLHRFGKVLPGTEKTVGQITVYDDNGKQLSLERTGYDHFD